MRVTVYLRVWPVLALLLATSAMAQHDEHDLPHRDSLKQDSRLFDIMRKGRLTGRFRQYNMATVNDGTPQDFHAIAFGGVLGYASERWKGLQFRMAAGFTFDLNSTTFQDPDPVTGQFSRYEIGLFDVTDPTRVEDLSYLHEFQLNYISKSGRHRTVFGKQELNTPFLNPQDGRMHPTLFEGIWQRSRIGKRTELQGGWLYRVAPRGTSRWYHVEESTHLYPVGRNILGRPSEHGERQRSLGIFAAHLEHRVAEQVSVSLWDLYVENMFNTAMVQVAAGDKESRWSASAMAVQQQTVARGSLADADVAYMPSGEGSRAISVRVRNVPGKFRWQANYTRITADGRFLMPREWGRDPFYTFLPRERNEGLGDVHAATVNLILRDLRPGLRIEVDGGAYWLPAITDARLNKYAMPSYAQYVLNTQYQFSGGWKGMAVQLLYLYKTPLYDQALTERQAFNKVDMHHVNLIINYAF
jgi:hypothetical protein